MNITTLLVLKEFRNKPNKIVGNTTILFYAELGYLEDYNTTSEKERLTVLLRR